MLNVWIHYLFKMLRRGHRLQEACAFSLIFTFVIFLILNRRFHYRELKIGPSIFDDKSPLIFIGGVPRSGTTLMRAMLDAHPLVRCGEETRVIPKLLAIREQWRIPQEWNRLQQAGVTSEVINKAISSFILQVITGHGTLAPLLCNKDPLTMHSALYLHELFPNAKFILMIRDGRAAVHSMITRQVTVTGFDLKSFRQSLRQWNYEMSVMVEQCDQLGKKCMKVKYENLVLHPESIMRDILTFLDIPWDSIVLHHEELIGKEIQLSNLESSSDQVVMPVNVDALSKWVGGIPDDIMADIDKIAPMLSKLGYDPHANPPNYGKADEIVAKKTDDVHKNAK